MFTKKIAETKTYFYKQVDDKQARKFLTERPSSDGAFGLEWECSSQHQNLYLFYNVFAKCELSISSAFKTIVPQKDISIFTLGNSHSPSFPFKIDYNNFLWDELKDIQKSLNDEKIFVQMIFKKAKNQEDWQNSYRQQYDDYLQGIELPTSNQLIRSLQFKALDFIKTKDEWIGENPEIPFALEKYNELGFFTSIRVIISRGNPKSRRKIINEVNANFSKLDYANQWVVSYNPLFQKRLLHQIQLRQIQNKGLVLSLSEIMPFFSSQNVEEEEINKNIETVQEIKKPKTNNRLLDILPYGDQSERDDTEIDNIVEQFKIALGKLNLTHSKIDIQNTMDCPTVYKIDFHLPDGLKLSTLQSSLKDIQVGMAQKTIGIIQGKEAETCSLIIPKENRSIVYLRDCIAQESFTEFSKNNDLPFIIGMDINGEYKYDCLTRIKHLLDCGLTGSGKSVWLNGLLLTLLTHKTPQEVQFLMIDPKKVELTCYQDYPHVLKVETDMTKAGGLLKSVVAKMEERYEIMNKSGCRNIKQHNSNSKNKIPYIVVVIDELADLIQTNPTAEDYIIRLAQKSRAAGIHLIIATQYPIATVITSLIKRNIYSRICFACDSTTAYRVVLDEKPPYQLLGKGDGIYRFEGINGLNRFQGAVISMDDDESVDVIEELSDYWSGDFDVEELEEVNEITEYDKVKIFIAKTGETKVGKIRGELKINQNRLTEHMQQLVEEGWLKSPETKKKGYKLLLTDIEREIYLDSLKAE
jgi:S-DNA-T family DNA segregation ATPase FtsK/SpoIIIE